MEERRGLPIEELDFQFPEELIAVERAPVSRVMVLQATAEPSEIPLDDVPTLFRTGDLVVVNETKVLRRRVFTDDGIEILFLTSLGADRMLWEVLCPSSRWKSGTKKSCSGVEFELIARGRPQVLRASRAMDDAFFETNGELPLPPYIQKARGERHNRAADRGEYQSVWATSAGSLAAPTASFHFDAKFEEALRAGGVDLAKITLHIGLGTFLPVTAADLKDHRMHAEHAEISSETLLSIEACRVRGGRVIAIGTTVARTLESWATGRLAAGPNGVTGETDLLIQPGYEWQVVDVLLTNFHQPRSTLLALVASFAGLSRVKRAYAWAIEKRFRLFSYGDLCVLMRANT